MSRLTRLLHSPTPQSQPISTEQVKNDAGGYVFSLDSFGRLERFLILGSDGGTYYAKPQKLTRDNAKCVLECWTKDPQRTANIILSVSLNGRAPKQGPTLFALALGACHESEAARQHALEALEPVCRTASHLMEFLANCRDLGRGWGRSLKRAVRDWYLSLAERDRLAYQMIKYRERSGYSHKRLIESAHVSALDKPEVNALLRWARGKDFDVSAIPPLVAAHLVAMKTDSNTELLGLIRDHNLPWEAIPTEAKSDPKVWEALLPTMGLMALLRNLGTFSRLGLTNPMSETEMAICARLCGSEEALKRARIHPYAILLAGVVYRSGASVKGSTTWTPSQNILAALDKAFRLAFTTVEPTGKRHLIALDVSGSMTSPVMNDSPLSCRDATAALSLITMEVEPACHVVGFTASQRASSGYLGRNSAITPLGIERGMSLGAAVRTVSGLPFGGTDCAQPMLYALERGIQADVFVVMTDSETWAGNIHPMEALRQYRRETGINAKLVVVGMTSTGFTIADPKDAGALDVVGFDADAPAAIANWIRG